MNSQQSTLLFVVYFFLGFIIPLTFLRCYTRFRILKSFGVDDVLVILSAMIYCVYAGLIAQSVSNGVGVHISELNLATLIEGVKYLHLAELAYFVLSCTTKLIVASMLLRLGEDRRHLQMIWASIIINICVCSGIWFYFLFQCSPISYAWKQADPTAKGKCLDPNILVILGYCISAVSISLELFYAIIPWFMFWKLQMKRSEKLVLMCLLSLGLFTTIANIIRLKYLVGLASPTDPLYSIAITVVWTVVEIGLSLVIGCIIPLRPFFRKYGKFLSTKSSSTNQHDTSESRTGRPTKATFGGYVLESTSAGRHSHSSKERILGGDDMLKERM
ncbi:hypothetical protein EJ02DRAFT_392089 [Clathrospora elynae]|uniref:Rhodopsin domain-containing protein n=1 Tax=Clathrospora elynae TaxID=706981 RepID=A0A6A5T5Y1_9PLEO|nr:hypothetical protein EJ02DRAFT_392089 [Clathrospora elynae]